MGSAELWRVCGRLRGFALPNDGDDDQKREWMIVIRHGKGDDQALKWVNRLGC